MKLVVLDEFQFPEIIDVLSGGDLIIVDHKLHNNLEEGDLIQVPSFSFGGTSCYLVIGVQPQAPHGDQLVRITDRVLW